MPLLSSESDTARLGRNLAALLRVGDVVCLEGDLGAGKTTLARALIQSLCGDISVPSPTYTLVETYDAPAFTVWHFDLYRLTSPEQIWELGVEEALDQGVTIIEWPDIGGGAVPSDALRISLTMEGVSRKVEISAGPSWAGRVQSITTTLENRNRTPT